MRDKCVDTYGIFGTRMRGNITGSHMLGSSKSLAALSDRDRASKIDDDDGDSSTQCVLHSSSSNINIPSKDISNGKMLIEGKKANGVEETFLPPSSHNTQEDKDTLAGNEPEKLATSLLDYTLRQKITLACLIVSSFNCYLCLSLLAPFFPKEAELRGISSTISGWIFGIFALVKCITSPLCGKLIPILGSKTQLLIGDFCLGASTILFGMLDFIPYAESNMAFIVVAFTFRITLALGAAATATASFTIAATVFKNNETTVMGLIEAAYGIGLMVGPAVGGVIYQRFGFKGPFIFIGTFIILTVPLYWAALQTPKESPEELPSSNEERKDMLKRFISIPVVLIICLAIFIGALCWIVLDLTLEPHLRPYNLSASVVGLVFLLMAATYAISSPIAGRITDRTGNSTLLLIFGFTMAVIGMLCIGPSPLLGLGDFRALWLDLVSLIILGIGVSFSSIPTYNKMLNATQLAGLPQTVALHALVGGVWNALFDLGEFVGPVFSGWLVDNVGFHWCITIVAFINLFMVLVTIMLWICEKRGVISLTQCMYKPTTVITDPATLSIQAKDPLIPTINV